MSGSRFYAGLNTARRPNPIRQQASDQQDQDVLKVLEEQKTLQHFNS